MHSHHASNQLIQGNLVFQLTPAQAAALANSAYLAKDAQLELVNPADLKLPKDFALGVEVDGRSGIASGTLTGFGFVAAGSKQHEKEAIVAIRGTASAADAFTDALIGAGVSGPSGTTVHTGFNRT